MWMFPRLATSSSIQWLRWRSDYRAIFYVQAMHDKMRQMLRSVPAGGLDPSAGKARPDQLVLPYDPSFLPENNLPGLGLDLSKLNRLLEIDASQQSSVLMPQTPNLSQSALSSSSILGLNLPSDENILRDLGGFSSEAGPASSVQGGVDLGGMIASSLDEAGVLLQPDFEFDEDGNIVELGMRNESEVRARPVSEARENGANEFAFDDQPLLVDEDIEMAITNEPARPARPVIFSDVGDDAPREAAETEPTEVRAPQRQRAPKLLASDGQTALRNAELAAMNDEYLHNMAVASKHKRQNKVSTQAKKNAEYWVFGLGIGSVGAGVGSTQVMHPLHFFSGENLYELVRKRPLEDDPEAEERRVRAREDDEQGRIDLVDEIDLWNEDVELGRHQSPDLHDDNSSQMPWNITASVQSSRHGAPAANIFGGLGSVSDFSSRGIAESVASFGRAASAGPSGIGRRNRLTSASPLAGRGFPYDLDNLSIPGNLDDDLDKLEGFDLTNYLDDNAAGDSNSTAEPVRPSQRSQQLQNSLTESVMDQEGLNFLDFLATKIDSQKPAEESTANASDNAEITFSTLLPPQKTTAAVATQGLMHILALATKGFLRVRQDAYQDQSSVDEGVRYEYGEIFVRLVEV
ncbi:Rad21/Rec8 N terminal domain protein [Aspergillus mulundensis]|uniref:Rad21/Rec8-like protein C-terminal eukaryotic domain-containing protein n=1 Tax=Aspergillus mulundensis TaxID=1810919 RepID=A0A3D8RES8_9EURO|nr:hypothetical protein DSM5745_07714 [Aspergillus mulundensis]RDW72542.1 hypothetical protein DSM5745_07714 [Aspergillus mulundensis]